jgi:hypothetical protein
LGIIHEFVFGMAPKEALNKMTAGDMYQKIKRIVDIT